MFIIKLNQTILGIKDGSVNFDREWDDHQFEFGSPKGETFS